MAYTAKCDTAVATKWWITGTGSSINRLSEVMDDNPSGVEEHDNPGNYQPWTSFMTEHKEDELYEILLLFEIGDGSTVTSLESKNESLLFTNCHFEVRTNAIFTVGEKDATSERGINGSRIEVQPTGTADLITDDGTLNLYGSMLHNNANFYVRFGDSSPYGTLDILDSILSSIFDIGDNGNNTIRIQWALSTIKRLSYVNCTMFIVNRTPTSIEDVLIVGVNNTTDNIGLLFGAAGTITVDDIGMFGSFTYFIQLNNTTSSQTLEYNNPKVEVTDRTKIYLKYADSLVCQKYDFDLLIKDSGGSPIEGTAVVMKYAHLVEGSDSKTYKCIQDHTAIDATHKPITGSTWTRYWKLYDSGGGLGGNWITGAAYKADSQEFSANSDAQGSITTQKIEKSRFGIDTAPGASDEHYVRLHALTCSKVGYVTLTIDDILIDSKTSWQTELQSQAQPPAAWQGGMM